jgi:hypothetical protein
MNSKLTMTAALALVALTCATAQAWKKARQAELGALRARAEAGDAQAQFEMGVKLDNGDVGLPPDDAAAAAWYRRAAEQGHARAQNSLGSLYQFGEGVPQDWAEAGKWYRLSAAQKYPLGLMNVGQLYDEGLGVPVDDVEARRLYLEAAGLGSFEAMNNLALMIADGEGGAKDLVDALAWSLVAQSMTVTLDDMRTKWAIRGAHDLIAARMEPKAIVQAEKLAKERSRALRAGSDGPGAPAR